MSTNWPCPSFISFLLLLLLSFGWGRCWQTHDRAWKTFPRGHIRGAHLLLHQPEQQTQNKKHTLSTGRAGSKPSPGQGWAETQGRILYLMKQLQSLQEQEQEEQGCGPEGIEFSLVPDSWQRQGLDIFSRLWGSQIHSAHSNPLPKAQIHLLGLCQDGSMLYFTYLLHFSAENSPKRQSYSTLPLPWHGTAVLLHSKKHQKSPLFTIFWKFRGQVLIANSNCGQGDGNINII